MKRGFFLFFFFWSFCYYFCVNDNCFFVFFVDEDRVEVYFFDVVFEFINELRYFKEYVYDGVYVGWFFIVCFG